MSDLPERLRSQRPAGSLEHIAAARIEELERELRAWRSDIVRLEGHDPFTCNAQRETHKLLIEHLKTELRWYHDQFGRYVEQPKEHT